MLFFSGKWGKYLLFILKDGSPKEYRHPDPDGYREKDPILHNQLKIYLSGWDASCLSMTITECPKTLNLKP
jgi:hypothetical protein